MLFNSRFITPTILQVVTLPFKGRRCDETRVQKTRLLSPTVASLGIGAGTLYSFNLLRFITMYK